MSKHIRRPRVPLLMVLFAACLLVAAVFYVTAHVPVSINVLEPIVVTAMVMAGGATRIYVR